MNNIVSIGSKAPDFTAQTTFGTISLSDFSGSWVILFSHWGDFTPVCTTEFIALSKSAEEFAKRNTQLLGISTDSNFSHLAWIHAIKMTTGVTVPFPIISDRCGKIASMYGMATDYNDESQLVRNVYIIDPLGIIRSILIYPSTNGRSVDELLRILSALQKTDAENVITPVNWQMDDSPMYPVPETYGELCRAEEENADSNNDWYENFQNGLNRS